MRKKRNIKIPKTEKRIRLEHGAFIAYHTRKVKRLKRSILAGVLMSSFLTYVATRLLTG